MARQILRALAAAGVLLTLACGGDAATAPKAADVVGAWGLHTVNGAQLPYILQVSGTDSVLLLSDTYTLQEGGKFTEDFIVRWVLSGQATIDTTSDEGTYTLRGSALTVTYASDSAVATASVSGDTFVISPSGYSLVYRRK